MARPDARGAAISPGRSGPTSYRAARPHLHYTFCRSGLVYPLDDRERYTETAGGEEEVVAYEDC